VLEVSLKRAFLEVTNTTGPATEVLITGTLITGAFTFLLSAC
jgi:hypothetical protein